MAWFPAPDYAATRDAMADRDRLPADHAVWLVSATQIEGELARVGFEVVRVDISRDDFLAWCGAQGVAPDARARGRYANGIAGIAEAP
jgi:hypothetical protein